MNTMKSTRTLAILLLVVPLFATAQEQDVIETPTPRETRSMDESIQVDEPMHTDAPAPVAQEHAVLTIVEQMPEFPGGQDALMKYLANNITYPEIAREASIQGRVYLTFVVDKEGAVRDIRVLRGVSPDLDLEAIRVVKAMPKWNPGKQNGRVCNVQYTLPVMFKLTD